MKKSLSVILVLAIILALSACGTKPETAVDGYFTAAKAFDPEGMKAMVDPANEEAVSAIAEFSDGSEDEYTKYFQDYLKESAKKITYTISGSEVDGDTAIVTVECKYIDGGPILSATVAEAFKKMMGIAFSGAELTEEETNQMFLDIMNEQTESLEETYKETTVKINCIKKDSTWYIADVNDDLLDVVTSGFVSAASDLGKAFGSD